MFRQRAANLTNLRGPDAGLMVRRIYPEQHLARHPLSATAELAPGVEDVVDLGRRLGGLTGPGNQPKQQGGGDKRHGDGQVPRRQERPACRDRVCHLVPLQSLFLQV